MVIAIAFCFALPQKASAFQYTTNATIQIGTLPWVPFQPVYAYCAVVYNVDTWGNVTIVSYTVLGPPM